MFEHFSEQARRVVTLSQAEALSVSSEQINPEHIMLALLTSEEGLIKTILDTLGTDVIALDDSIRAEYPAGKRKNVSSVVKLSTVATNVLKSSVREALTLKSKLIQPEHILAAVIRNSQDELVMLLKNHNITYREVMSIINANSDSGSSLPTGMTGFGGVAKPNVTSETRDGGVLEGFASNLSALAREGKLDPVIGRDKEVSRVVQILSRRFKNNPILIGEPGVGKTAIVEGLAQALLEPDAPKSLRGKQIFTLDLAAVVAGARYRGDFEERMKKIMGEVSSRDDIILFIDEIHTMVGAGGNDGSMDASNIMKPMLARGAIQTIGATTLVEFRKHFSKDAALERRFQPVNVEEPSVEETTQILVGLRDRYENFHKVTITDEALTAAAVLSSRYIQDRHLPDKAIDLIDEAAARVKLKSGVVIPEIAVIDQKISELMGLKAEAISSGFYAKAGKFSKEEAALISERQKVQENWDALDDEVGGVVTELTIADLLAESTGIPVSKITHNEASRLLGMEKELHKRLIGQNEAVKVLSRTIRRQRTGLKDPKRPVGSFIFAGPTGVGKAQPLTSSVLTPEGFKLMGDIVVGHVICTPAGGVAVVDGVFPQGVRDVFEVVFGDGRVVEASDEHLWKTFVSSAGTWNNLTTLTIAEMLAAGEQLFVPSTAPTFFMPQPALGLGEVRRFGESVTNGEVNEIPVRYKTGSPAERFELLEGITGTIGSVDGFVISSSTVNSEVLGDIQYVVHSVGGFAELTGDGLKVSYTEVSLDNTNVVEVHNQIVSTKKVREDEVQCIHLNDEKHLYLTDGFVVTHNTELAKTVSEFLFSSEKSLITLDMSEFAEKHSVARLFGPPPGYVGYEDGGQLTEAVRRNPFSVILLDEIEKAHPAVFDPLLQVLEEGRLTDGQGRVVDFKNTVIIMTTNLGAREISASPIGFQFGGAGNDASNYESMKSKVLDALKDNMRPEFLNRVDDVVVFPHLGETELLQIVDIFVNNLGERLVDNGFSVTVSDAARKLLCEIGYDKALGARPLRRAIQREIETPISEAILFGSVPKSGVIKVDVKGGKFTFNGLTHNDIEEGMSKLETV